MDRDSESLFTKTLNMIRKEDNSDLALVAMVEDSAIAFHLIDPVEANKKIDELSNGLIF